MCRWGCPSCTTTYMCKWCGTRYCRECLQGEFYGEMSDPARCRKCNQNRCQGKRIEYFPPPEGTVDDKSKKKDTSPSRSRSKSPGKTGKPKSAKKSGSKKKAKSGKKKKKKK